MTNSENESDEPKRRRRRAQGHSGIVGKFSRRMKKIALGLVLGTLILLFFAWLWYRNASLWAAAWTEATVAGARSGFLPTTSF